MNNDLEQFSEERLIEIVSAIKLESCDYRDVYDNIPHGEIAALARIALAAKQDKPVGYFRKMPNDSYYQLSKSTVGMDQIPLYTTPQQAHTEQVNSPMQPLHIDEFGTIRFKANAIVQHLLDVAKHVGVTMNTIAIEGFKPEDEMQFAQLIGYSLSGYGELSYVTDESYEQARVAAPKPESE